VTDVIVKLLVGDAVVVVRVLPEVVDPNVVEPVAEALAAPPDNAICSL
jgi:ABC-type Zn uptake system ZnuABC Zn-binding protein ZnuA